MLSIHQNCQSHLYGVLCGALLHAYCQSCLDPQNCQSCLDPQNCLDAEIHQRRLVAVSYQHQHQQQSRSLSYQHQRRLQIVLLMELQLPQKVMQLYPQLLYIFPYPYVIAQQSIKWYQMEWTRPLRLYCLLGDTRFHKTGHYHPDLSGRGLGRFHLKEKVSSLFWVSAMIDNFIIIYLHTTIVFRLGRRR